MGFARQESNSFLVCAYSCSHLAHRGTVPASKHNRDSMETHLPDPMDHWSPNQICIKHTFPAAGTSSRLILTGESGRVWNQRLALA
eukprot:731828-Amphidinium_carterae.1